MTFLAYTSGIPNGPDNPSNDQPDMKINNDNIPIFVAVDHVGFNTNLGGYHKIIHQTQNTVDPASIAGINQVYAKNYTPPYAGAPTDTQLFAESGLGGVSQLTGRNSIANGGWQWVAGTLLIWGNVTTNFAAPNFQGTVTFTAISGTTIPFPNNCFQVYTSMNGNSTTPNFVQIVSKSATNFTWSFTVHSSAATSYTGFSWLAIGN